MFIYKEKPIVTGAMSLVPYSYQLEKALTVESRFGETIELFKKNGSKDTFYIPRALCPISDNDKRSDGVKVDFQSSITPRNEEQGRVIQEATELLEKAENFIIEAPTGSGKTIVALQLIANLGVKALIVVTKEDLRDHWKSEAIKHLGLEPSEIGLIQGDILDVVGKKIVIAMIHTACKGKYPLHHFSDIGFVTWDEIHRAAATTFSETVGMFPAKLRLGLSATPDRSDGKEIIFHAHIGPVKVRATQLKLIPKIIIARTGWKTPRYPNGKLMVVKAGRAMHVLVEMAKDVSRNELIVSYILRAYKKGRNLIFFSDLAVEKHLGRIKFLLLDLGVSPKDISFYIGGMSKTARDKAKGAKIILSTYKMGSEGTDIPWLDTVILGTPRADVKQIVGRVMREYPGKPIPVVVDLVDDNNIVFAKYSYKRIHFYKSMGSQIILDS